MFGRLVTTIAVALLATSCASSGLLRENDPVYGHLVFRGEAKQIVRLYPDEAPGPQNPRLVVILLDRVEVWWDEQYLGRIIWEGEAERAFRRSMYAELPSVGERVAIAMLLHRNFPSHMELERFALHILHSDHEIWYKPILDPWH